jgi:hypothetical protein
LDPQTTTDYRYRLVATPEPNRRFQAFHRSGRITLRTRRVFTRSDVFFTMGSCFAEELRIALRARDLACVPRYGDLRFDPRDVRVDELPARAHLNFYNTFTVLQQLQQMLGELEVSPEDFWVVDRGLQGLLAFPPPAYQDPYRRLVFGRTPELLAQALSALLENMRAGFAAATAFVFTFGMTEVFVNRRSGLVACQKPAYGGAGGRDETRMHLSGYEENLQNVRRTIELVRAHKPAAPIVVSVSPVPLERTFSDERHRCGQCREQGHPARGARRGVAQLRECHLPALLRTGHAARQLPGLQGGRPPCAAGGGRHNHRRLLRGAFLTSRQARGHGTAPGVRPRGRSRA